LPAPRGVAHIGTPTVSSSGVAAVGVFVRTTLCCMQGSQVPVVNHLADTWQRFAWANDARQAFGELSGRLGQPGTYTIRTEFTGDRWAASFHRVIDPTQEAVIFDEPARALGAFLDHTRTALNYAAYQLALLAIREDPALVGTVNPGRIEFPIFTQRAVFTRYNRFKTLPERYRDAIETLQPFDGQKQGLWTLHELARESRHRVVHPVAIWPSEDHYTVWVDGKPIPATDVEVVPHDRLEDGDILMRVRIPGANSTSDVRSQVVVAVGIDHPLCRGRTGTDVLDGIRAEAAATLLQLAEGFFA